MFTDVTNLFCDIDDFCQVFQPEMNQNLILTGLRVRLRSTTLALSEIMTILVLFHSSRYRDFKHFYFYLKTYHLSEFPNLVSYNRFVELTSSALIPLCSFLETRKGKTLGVNFIDSTSIIVCNNKRIFNHKVFEGFAKRGKTTMGWFFGFVLHIFVNDIGELLAFKLTPGNTDDRKPLKEGLAKNISGILYGDKGYISQSLFDFLYHKGVKLVTPLRGKMKNILMPLMDKILLKKRSLIETINNQLKNISHIQHTRHRSVVNFMVNLICGLIAYTYQIKKPSIKIRNI